MGTEPRASKHVSTKIRGAKWNKVWLGATEKYFVSVPFTSAKGA